MSKINLLPWREERKAKRKQQFWLSFGLSVMLTVVALAGVQFYINGLQKAQSARNQYLDTQIVILDAQIGEIRAIKARKQALEERIALIERLQLRRNLPTKMFNQLPLITPEGVYLDELSYAGLNLALDGMSEANYRVASFMRNIEQRSWLAVPQISSIVAQESEDERLNLSRFHIDVTIELVQPDKESEDGSSAAQ
ncbi:MULTISPECIES: PilN domain-containing protein [Aliagarivorans]|uniref:PilN domain-containing protein n=1 Tax=Aliagarivorans TaxID=882379 RepID=UPI00040878B5|nr:MULTISPECIES: PilN domain-containing protein [Aliagarivorans]